MHKNAGRLAALASTVALLASTGVAAAADPTVVTGPPDTSLISDSYALISGTINPNGNDSSYHFEWGTSTTYGQVTPTTQAGNGKAEVPVDISLDELEPSTTYHYRLVVEPGVSNPGAFAPLFGADASFKTSPTLALQFRALKAAVNKAGKATVKVRAEGPVDETAAGKLTLAIKVKGKAKKIGSARYKVDVGRNGTLLVKLNKAGKTALAESGKLVVT